MDFLSLDNDLMVVEAEETGLLPDEYSQDEESAKETPKSLWEVYSEVKWGKPHELFVPTAAKSARQIVVLFSFAGSGSKHILLSLGAHQHLCVCEDLCLMPFKTLAERHSIISSTENSQYGLISTIQALRNCKISNKIDLFGSVANTYRALQEWCAPRILVDGTEAYSAVPEWSLTEAKNVFLDPDIVHLLRNPRECLGNAQGSGDNVELEPKWVKFTKFMLQRKGTDVLEIRYENLKKAGREISSRLLIPNLDLVIDVSKHSAEHTYEGPLQSDTQSIAWGLGYQLSSRHDKTSPTMYIRQDAIRGVAMWLRKGDKSKPTLVIPHALFGTQIGAPYLPHLPDDMPVVALQAPELVEHITFGDIRERAIYYRDILVSLLEGRSQIIHLFSGSFGGPLAFELAVSLKHSLL